MLFKISEINGCALYVNNYLPDDRIIKTEEYIMVSPKNYIKINNILLIQERKEKLKNIAQK